MKEKEDQVPLLNTSEIGFNCLFSGLSLHKSGSSSRADLYSMCSTNVCFLSQCSLNASLKKTQTHPSPHIGSSKFFSETQCILNARTSNSYLPSSGLLGPSPSSYKIRAAPLSLYVSIVLGLSFLFLVFPQGLKSEPWPPDCHSPVLQC